MFTSKELATLALLKNDSGESGDDDSLNKVYPSTSGLGQVTQSSCRAASVISSVSSGSDISVTRISPPPDMGVAKGASSTKSEAVDHLQVRWLQNLAVLLL